MGIGQTWPGWPHHAFAARMPGSHAAWLGCRTHTQCAGTQGAASPSQGPTLLWEGPQTTCRAGTAEGPAPASSQEHLVRQGCSLCRAMPRCTAKQARCSPLATLAWSGHVRAALVQPMPSSSIGTPQCRLHCMARLAQARHGRMGQLKPTCRREKVRSPRQALTNSSLDRRAMCRLRSPLAWALCRAAATEGLATSVATTDLHLA